MSRPLREIPPCPPGFADRFITDGWRGVERVYGASTPLLLKWIEASGGEDLHRRRREHYRAKTTPAVMPRARVA
jgi:hypothetical protein